MPVPVASPLLVMVAVEGSDEFHEAVTGEVDPSLNVPTALNCWERPLATEAEPGDTAIETNAAAVTVKDAELVRDSTVAEILVLPSLSPVARPAEEMAAMAGFDEVQVAVGVTSRVEPSLNLPNAV